MAETNLEFATRQELLEELAKRHSAMVFITAMPMKVGQDQESFNMVTRGGAVASLGLLDAGIVLCRLRVLKEITTSPGHQMDEEPQ